MKKLLYIFSCLLFFSFYSISTNAQCNCGTIVISSNQDLWGTTGRSAFNQAIDGALLADGFTAVDFTAASASSIFTEDNCFVVLEGSDGGYTEFSNFITANMALMENWVQQGGVLFMNAAPNSGDPDLNVGFGGIVIDKDVFTPNVVGNAAHPIFSNGCAQPTDVNMSGNSYGHSIICPAGMSVTSIITDVTGTMDLLIETGFGDGIIMVGGMTTPNFHVPNLEAQNARQNMYCYGKSEACIRDADDEAIPTMSEWGLMIFGLLTLNMGVIALRRKEELLA